jgi:hypothetical protein
VLLVIDEDVDELDTFMATVTPADFSDWEFRLFKHYRLRAERRITND